MQRGPRSWRLSQQAGKGSMLLLRALAELLESQTSYLAKCKSGSLRRSARQERSLTLLEGGIPTSPQLAAHPCVAACTSEASFLPTPHWLIRRPR
eukprot:1156319-Pelagomonas_calceolata.AAC.12